MRAKTFSGTPTTAALWNPWVTPADLQRGFGGVPLGPELRTRRLTVFDPWRMQQNGDINATVIRAFGVMNAGKTTLLRTLFRRTMALQAGVLGGEPVQSRGRIHSRKPEGNEEDTDAETEESEYTVLGKHLHSETFSPHKHGSINIFDPRMGMSYADIVETAVNFAELNADRRLRGFEPLALQISAAIMYNRYPGLHTRELLVNITRGLDMSDVDAYFAADSDEILGSYKDALAADTQVTKAGAAHMGSAIDLFSQLKATLTKPHNINTEDFLRDAGMVSSFLGQVVTGSSIDLFRGFGSIYDIMSRDMVTIDWDNITGKARSALEAMMYKWESLRPELRPHVNLQDELGVGLDSLILARALYNRGKKARAYKTCDITGTQFRFDITRKGEPGSELRTLSEGIMLSTGLYLFCAQPEYNDVLDDLSTLKISDDDLDYMTTMPPGHFGMKAPREPIMFFKLQLTPSDWLYNRGNAASANMTDRQNAWENPRFIERAQRYGVTRIGGS